MKADPLELRASDFVDGDPCGGQFCLLLLEPNKEKVTVLRRRGFRCPFQTCEGRFKAIPWLRKAAELLRKEPVKVFHVSALKHRGFRAFGAHTVLWRPKRRRYEPYLGPFEAQEIARFAPWPLGEACRGEVQGALHRGTALPRELRETLAM